MGWGWKVAGFCIGAAGGPAGALLGAGIGHLLDKGSESKGEVKESAETVHTRNHLMFIYYTTAFLRKVAAADGNVDKGERKLILSVAKDMWKRSIPSFPKERVRTLVIEVLEKDTDCTPLLEIARDNSDLRWGLLSYAWRIAAKDGNIDENEIGLIAAAGKMMGCNENEVYLSSVPYYRAKKDQEKRRLALGVLGLPFDAPVSEIKTAYRNAAKLYHPDRHASAAPELRALASEKLAALNQAYQDLKDSNREVILYGKAPREKMTFSVKEGDTVQCYMCEANLEVGESRYWHRLRCPDCQALVLHEEAFADALCKD